MSGLGLDSVAETVYLTALTRVRWRLADLNRHIDLGHPDAAVRPHPDGRVAAALDRLRADGLMVASAEESGAVRAVDPALALPVLAASRVWGLSAGDSRPQALSIAQLIARHEPPGPDHLYGLDEMNSFAEHLVANARREVVILSGEHRTGSFEFATPVAEAVLRRGAQLRLVWRSELIRTPAVAAHATWLRTRGAAPRIVPILPTTMLLVDRSVAMVITGDRAVVNRATSSVTPLCVLADQLWANSGPGPRRPHLPDETPRHHKVLRLLADGLTDDAIARQVGVSVRTVRNDMAAAMLSLDARSRFQAGVRAAQLGLL
ncbi:helix-turn-helix transcriptional regulator [Kutzneria sp. 744]|uniref:helix-turn-helix transcriptional regulator n=1 Tax=Kutzneria sp. (strain 744) TaxID=345341 RepID=UPI0004BA7713|nr:helix-turn-helix transcriptional regulator [Kutzneria sp. 744]